MTIREAYEKEVEQQLSELNTRIKELAAKADQAGAEAAGQYQRLLSEMRARQTEAEGRLRELKDASDNAWEDLQRGMGNAVGSLQDAIARAGSHFRSEAE